MSTTSSFKSIENKCDVNSDEGCMKKFGESLRKHVMTIINCFLFMKELAEEFKKQLTCLEENT